MTDKTPEEISNVVARLISNSDDRLFEQFDNLHKKGIHDDDVILALRRMDERGLAERYMDWAGALDPEREPNETLGGVVPDPVPAASYAQHPLNLPAVEGDPIEVDYKEVAAALNRNAINAYLRSDHIVQFGARENTLQLLRKNIPVGTRVAYWPSGNFRDPEWTEAVTSTEVFIAAGTPVVSLESGRQAAALTSMQVL